MATTANEQTRQPAAEASMRWGSGLMGLAAVGFIGHAVIFLFRNFTDSFLELGIGPSEVQVGKDAIQAFSPSLFHYISHLHIAVSGFIAATGMAVLFLVAYGVRRGELWAWVGAVGAPVLGLAVALPARYRLRHPGPPGTHLPGHRDLRGRGAAGAAGDHHPASKVRVALWVWPSTDGPTLHSEAHGRGRDRTMQAPATLLCAKCGEATDGWKCAICGSVARQHDPGHLHAGSDRYCTLRCAGCGQADVHCTCV